MDVETKLMLKVLIGFGVLLLLVAGLAIGLANSGL
jgi:hypothetical protein